MDRKVKEKTRAELAAEGLAAAPKDGKVWYADQFISNRPEWEYKLDLLYTAGIGKQLQHQDENPDPEWWMLSLIHSGGYVYCYYRCTSSVMHEYYTTEEIAGPDPAWAQGSEERLRRAYGSTV